MERHLVFYKVNSDAGIITIYAVVDSRQQYKNLL